MKYEPPDLSHMTVAEIVPLMLACGMSNDPSDRAFAKACRDEIARRKPDAPAQNCSQEKTP